MKIQEGNYILTYPQAYFLIEEMVKEIGFEKVVDMALDFNRAEIDKWATKAILKII